jgi:hypothetical protein
LDNKSDYRAYYFVKYFNQRSADAILAPAGTAVYFKRDGFP